MIWAAVLSGIATLLGILVLCRTFGPEGSLKKQQALRKRIADSPFPEKSDIPFTLEKIFQLGDIKFIQNFLSRYESSKEVANLLKRAQLKITVSVFLLSCLLLGALSFMGLRFYVGSFLAALLAGGIAFVPFLYLKFRNKRHLQKFSEYLPEALSMMSGALKTGFSLQAAVDIVAKNAPYPVCVEFQTAVSEMRLGQPLGVAFQNMYQRIKSTEMKIFSTGVAIQQELGGNLSEILDNLEKTIRDRLALEREVKVLSAEGVISYKILLAMPYVILGLILTMSPDIIKDFFSSPWGRPTIYVMLGLQLVAYLWMRKIVQLKE